MHTIVISGKTSHKRPRKLQTQTGSLASEGARAWGDSCTSKKPDWQHGQSLWATKRKDVVHV